MAGALSEKGLSWSGSESSVVSLLRSGGERGAPVFPVSVLGFPVSVLVFPISVLGFPISVLGFPVSILGCRGETFATGAGRCRFLQDLGNIPVDAICVVCGVGDGGCKARLHSHLA